MRKEFILKIDDRGRITIPKEVRELLKSKRPVSYTHLTLPTIYSV